MNSVTPLASNGASNDGSPPRKKARKGKKKSKAERLSRGLNLTTTSSATVQDTTVSFEELQNLLDAPDATTSAHWDRAQAVTMRLATPEARQLMIRRLVFKREAHKAAVHYARRLRISSDELLEVLQEGRDDAKCLAVARFLADAGTHLIDNATRISEFIIPWLDAHKAKNAAIVNVEEFTNPSVFSASVRCVLGPHVAQKKPKMELEKIELQHALVKAILGDPVSVEAHAGTALRYAASFTSALQDARLTVIDLVDVTPRNNIDTEHQRRIALAHRVEEFLQKLWPDARVVVFGSSATKLLLMNKETSADDVDLCVLLPSCPQFLDATASLVADIKDHLALYLPGDVVAVTRARVPIVKWTDAETQLQCDLCVNNVAALWNTQLTLGLTQDDLVRKFSLWMKRWYKSHRHEDGFAAGLSSYGMQLLVFHFLHRVGLVPSSFDFGPLILDATTLHQPDLESEIQKRVLQAIEAARQSSQPLREHSSLWSLVVGFFEFYGANTFDYEHHVVSLRQPCLTKTDKEWTRRNWRFSLSIEDPIEMDRDLGTLFSRVSLTRFRLALVAACIRIAEAHAAGETTTATAQARVLNSLLQNSQT